MSCFESCVILCLKQQMPLQRAKRRGNGITWCRVVCSFFFLRCRSCSSSSLLSRGMKSESPSFPVYKNKESLLKRQNLDVWMLCNSKVMMNHKGVIVLQAASRGRVKICDSSYPILFPLKRLYKRTMPRHFIVIAIKINEKALKPLCNHSNGTTPGSKDHSIFDACKT